jgi:glycosyltransferase involved in cell wall biosynthesis
VKVLVVHNRYRSAYPSGEDRVVDAESDLLARAGCQVVRFERCSDDIDAMGLVRRALVPAGVVWSRRSRADLRAVVRDERPDVVHVHNLFPLISSGVFGMLRDEGVPVVTTTHGYKPVCAGADLLRDGAPCHDCVGRTVPLPALRHGCYRDSHLQTVPVALSLAVHRAAWRTVPARYITLSPAQREVLVAHGAPAERVVVKPNFVVAGPARPVGTPGRGVVYLGRFSREKGLGVLMAAWDIHVERLRRERPHAPDPVQPLRLAGAGPLDDEVAAWARRHPSVELLGHRSRAEAADVVASAAAVVLPSVWEETFGLVAVEAQAAGVAVIASAHGSFPWIVRDGVDGRLVAPGDAGALADALARVEADPAAGMAMGEAGRLSYRARFTPEANVAQLLAVYEAAIAGTRRARRTGRAGSPRPVPVTGTGTVTDTGTDTGTGTGTAVWR